MARSTRATNSELDRSSKLKKCLAIGIAETNKNILLYESQISQEFVTEDGSSLDVDCTRAYYTDTEQLVERMLIKINDVITTELCGDDVATAIAKTQTFFSFGNAVHIYLA